MLEHFDEVMQAMVVLIRMLRMLVGAFLDIVEVCSKTRICPVEMYKQVVLKINIKLSLWLCDCLPLFSIMNR